MTPDRRSLTMRRLAVATLLLMLIVTTASAWLRLAQARPACGDWPGCRSADRPVAALVAPTWMGAPPVLARVRGTHRVVATVVLLNVMALAALALAQRPRQRDAGRLALALLALALGLSVLGIVTPGSRAAAVLLGNLLGGLLMLALSWRLLLALQGAPRPSPGLARAALACAGTWAVQVALGALAGAGHMATAPVAHLCVALLAGSGALGVAWLARREGLRVEATALLSLTGLQFLLAAGAAGLAAAPAAVLLHNVGAALGLALLFGLARGAASAVPQADG